MFHHDAEHTGYSTSSAPTTNNVLWYAIPDYSVVYSSPAVVDGRLYIGGGNPGFGGSMMCFNITNGQKIWSYNLPYAIDCSPVVAHGSVYFSASFSPYLFCLDAVGNGEGSTILKWKFTAGSGFYTPILSDEKLYVGSSDAHVYCLDANGDGQGSTTILWQNTVDGVPSQCPAVSNGYVYVGTNHGFVFCFNAETGEKIWQYQPGIAETSPTVVDGKVYVNSLDWYVVCLDAYGDGYGSTTELWRHPTQGTFVDASPAVAYGNVYAATSVYAAILYCLDTDTGEEQWNYTGTPDTAITTSPAVADGKVFFYTTDDWFHCVNAETGEIIWEYKQDLQPDPPWITYSSPAVAEDTVFFGWHGAIFAFRDPPRPNVQIQNIKGGVFLSAEITNIGNEAVGEGSWELMTHGGLFGLIDVHSQGSFNGIDAGATLPIRMKKPILGFGPVNITMKVQLEELPTVWAFTSGFVLVGYTVIR